MNDKKGADHAADALSRFGTVLSDARDLALERRAALLGKLALRQADGDKKAAPMQRVCTGAGSGQKGCWPMASTSNYHLRVGFLRVASPQPFSATIPRATLGSRPNTGKKSPFKLKIPHADCIGGNPHENPAIDYRLQPDSRGRRPCFCGRYSQDPSRLRESSHEVGCNGEEMLLRGCSHP
jgi:hypothetical protein